jgi:hypothetical protein
VHRVDGTAVAFSVAEEDHIMDKNKEAKRSPGPERRFPDANRPDTLRPGPGERDRKGRPRQNDDEKGRPAQPVK